MMDETLARHTDLAIRVIEDGMAIQPKTVYLIPPKVVLQDAWLEASQRLDAYSTKGDLPFFLWLRLIVGQKLIDLRRHHIGVQKRSAGREISIDRRPMPEATLMALAAQLLGRVSSTSRSSNASPLVLFKVLRPVATAIGSRETASGQRGYGAFLVRVTDKIMATMFARCTSTLKVSHCFRLD